MILDNVEECWQNWTKEFKGKKVALYGAGEHTIMLEKHLGAQFYQMPISCLIDRTPNVKELFGYPVIKSNMMDFTQIDFIIISSRHSESSILNGLLDKVDEGKVRRFYQFSHQQTFEQIFLDNQWGSENSVSGPGSESEQTKSIVKQLPEVLSSLSITSILDIPCGDFNWMQYVVAKEVQYIGADIVGELIEHNNNKFNSKNIEFKWLDLLTSTLPKCDVIVCRDCLVHLSYEDIDKAMNNMIHSGAKYLITTTFTERQDNRDIETGGWRPINLCKAPFNLPKPCEVITEECSENEGIYRDKTLGVWKIKDIGGVQSGERL